MEFELKVNSSTSPLYKGRPRGVHPQGNEEEEQDKPGIYELDRTNPNEPTGSLKNANNYDLNSGSTYDTTISPSNMANDDANRFTGFPQDSSSNLRQQPNMGQMDSYQKEKDERLKEDKRRGFF